MIEFTQKIFCQTFVFFYQFLCFGNYFPGILLVALPVAIVGSKFQEVYIEDEKRKKKEAAKNALENEFTTQNFTNSSLET